MTCADIRPGLIKRIWADVDTAPAFLDFENRIVSYSRSVMKTTIHCHARNTLETKNPILELPGAIHYLTDQGSIATLYKAKGPDNDK